MAKLKIMNKPKYRLSLTQDELDALTALVGVTTGSDLTPVYHALDSHRSSRRYQVRRNGQDIFSLDVALVSE